MNAAAAEAAASGHTAAGIPVVKSGAPTAAMPWRDPVEGWMAGIVPGRTFVDVGGIGMGACNERVTFAVRAGALRAAMADIRPFSYFEWETFRRKCAEAGVNDADFDCYEQVDITNERLTEQLPVFDVVHCTGIFYHLASPVAALATLERIVGRYLIVNTVTVPARVEGESGALEFAGNTALFLPGTSDRERAILREHYARKFSWRLDDVAPALDAGATARMRYVNPDASFSCWPWWWLMTDDCFRSLLRLMNFAILDEWKWNDHCLFCLCERQD